MRFLLAVLVIAAPLLAERETVRSARLEFVFENGARANLAYHAICLTGRISCSAEAYKKLWKEKLGWTETDETLVADFRKEASFEGAPPVGRVPFPPNYPAFYEGERRQRDYFAGVLRDGPKRGSAAAKLMAAMRGRFDGWWRAEGEARTQRYARDLSAVLRKYELVEYSERVARLMGYQWNGKRRLRFHLIGHAEKDPNGSSATQIGDQAVIEAWSGFAARDMAAVTLHELFHYFYESMARERHVALMEQFAAHPEKFAGAYYVFFNEALVSAAAAGMDERMNPEKFREESTNLGYHHPYISKLAVALFPVVSERLKAGRDLLEGVVAEYIARGRKELGAEANSLRFALGSRAMEGDEALVERVKGPMKKLSPAVGEFGNEPELLRRFEHVNVVRVAVKPGAKAKMDRRDRTAKSLELSFVAPDAAALEKLIEIELSR